MQTILVAGGAGFIGSHLCSRLVSEGYTVICIDNVITGDKKNISDLINNPKFTFINHDITQKISGVSNIQYIFHLASPASPNIKNKRSFINNPIETLLANSQGTYQLLELAKKQGAKFLFASSSEVYGDPTISPQKEDYFGNVNPNGVRSVYDEGKRFGEAFTMAYVRKYKLDGRIVRIFNTYGPQMQVDDGRVVSNFVVQALRNQPITIYGDGLQTRSFCYVSDMVEGLYKAMFTQSLKGEVINLGNPLEQTILEFAMIVKELTKTKSEITHEPMPEDDPKKRKPDIAKAKKLLNWEPEVDIRNGLQKTIEHFRKVV